MTFLQVDRCSNEPFSTYCVYCVFYKFILRILRILQIVILEYCVYCIFYKLTSATIAYIALHILRCVFYNKPSRIPSVTERKQLFREQLSLLLISALLSNFPPREMMKDFYLKLWEGHFRKWPDIL